jgi:uncharacterized Zn-binding protein involved in type VI secretion
MPFAARVLDPTTHGAPLNPGPGSPDVQIGFQPAWRTIIDQHACPAVSITGADGVGSVLMGSPTVFIDHQMACRVGDIVVEKPGAVLGPADPILMGCPTVIIGDTATPGLSGPGPLTPDAAAALFAIMAAQPDIAFAYPADGCYARAHLMAQRMQQLGVTPGKVWSFASGQDDPLWVNTPHDPSGSVEWGYHVAPTVPVRGSDGVVRDMVMDPSLFDHPVSIDQWRDAQHDHPDIEQTALGQPPPGSPGSGYWPADDPAEGADENAHDTMRDYKAHQYP